jgi:anti-sigma factor (TIGR02949 family)
LRTVVGCVCGRWRATMNDIDCEQALKRILEFVDRELADEEREVVDRHLHTCRSCFSRMEFERQLKGKLQALSSDDAPSQTRDRIKALIQSF